MIKMYLCIYVHAYVYMHRYILIILSEHLSIPSFVRVCIMTMILYL